MQKPEQQPDTSAPRLPREEELLHVIEELYGGFAEAEETLSAIRRGEVDAFLVSTDEGEKIYTLKTAEHPYRILIEQMREGAAILSADGTILYSNASFARLLGMPLEKVMGESVHGFIGPAGAEDFRQTMAAGEPAGSTGESALQANGGGLVPVHLSLKPMPMDGVQAYSLVVFDLTERKVAEERLQRAYDELEDRVNERTAELAASNARLQVEIEERKRAEAALVRRTDDLVLKSEELEAARDEANIYLDIMTHDVRNANNVSSMYADLLVDLTAGDLQTYAEKLQGSIGRSSEILMNVATIRRTQTEGGRLVPVNLDAVIKEEIRNFPGAAIRYDDPEVEVLADNLLPVIFTNLIGNAVKFGGADVAVTITVEGRGAEVLVTVADTGPGVPDEVKGKLFHRFERGRASGRGEGLGLYIVRTLVERYGGTIRIEDRVAGKPEEGAAFRFTLRRTDRSENA
ncbi:PAS domain-containing sensor histidine kinase [Methanoculleus sp. FWC-SCC1]|uniref:histidine kinase n=1 Tax=Methanoculleus frigidifontis TaxID=2584085 RepID=A0ABT8M981_9EURY|nr:PAS domain-containing sensor histidine kinase [Methanoculleus sp. FWC-SCC1]MDN7024483.1 PAS domain-containing sensor histidine kinase [Methanoculleus sp. FWC-SCC1]